MFSIDVRYAANYNNNSARTGVKHTTTYSTVDFYVFCLQNSNTEQYSFLIHFLHLFLLPFLLCWNTSINISTRIKFLLDFFFSDRFTIFSFSPLIFNFQFVSFSTTTTTIKYPSNTTVLFLPNPSQEHRVQAPVCSILL